LRKFLRENRDGMSFDLIKIASKEIQGKLKQLDIFRDAKGIACYYPIGSEVRTQEIMQEILSEGRELSLPKVDGENLEFRKVIDFGYLQKSGFDIMEPNDSDELYYVIKGDGFLKINQRDYPVKEGKTFFVPKNIKHYFFGNKKELIIIYFFGGPDS